MELPFSQACENNKHPIRDELARVFKDVKHVLEIGAGTGQHATFFAAELPHLQWWPSDQAMHLPGLSLRCQQAGLKNLHAPCALDVTQTDWPEGFDAVYSANTAHIMPWEVTQHMVREVAYRLPEAGIFALYGPFNYNGKYTSDSNRTFDLWLKSSAEHQGIRAFEDINEIASHHGLMLVEDNAMPANNRLLVWRKSGGESYGDI